jgi:hypothetical protein
MARQRFRLFLLLVVSDIFMSERRMLTSLTSTATPSTSYVYPENVPLTASQSVSSTTATSSQTSTQSSGAQSSIIMTSKATPSAVIPSPPRLPQRQSNTVRGARLKAAIAVPLSLLAFILLLAGVFVFHLRRHRFPGEPVSDVEKDLSHDSSLNNSRSTISVEDAERVPHIAPESVSAPASIFVTRSLRADIRRDIGTSPHKDFLMSPSLRQSPVSSLDATPTTVPARVFRHARGAETNDAIKGSSIPFRLHAAPLPSSPLRQTLLRDDDEDEEKQ